MRVLVATLSVLLTLSECNGFVSESVSARSIAPLRAAPKDAEVAAPLDLRKTLTSFAVATALGWGVASGAAFASDNYADFSLPSYEAVTKAEINQNLKGDNFLFGEASKSMDSVISDSTAAAAPAVKEKSADELKADKAAKRAADKEARQKQQAAIEAAAAAKAAE